jgi:hypothetical protein
VRSAVVVCVIALVGAAACDTQANEEPVCRPGAPTTLMAESVPSASLVPCVREVPEGWSFQAFTADESAASFSLEQQDGGGSLTVSLQSSCPSPAPSSEDVTRAQTTRDDGRTTVWTTTFPGGCSVATLSLSETVTAAARRAARRALGTIARAELAPTSIAVTHVGP